MTVLQLSWSKTVYIMLRLSLQIKNTQKVSLILTGIVEVTAVVDSEYDNQKKKRKRYLILFLLFPAYSGSIIAQEIYLTAAISYKPSVCSD